MTLLSIILAGIQLLNYGIGFLTEKDKEKAINAVANAENMKNDLAAIHEANAARAAVPVDDDSLRLPNADSRT